MTDAAEKTPEGPVAGLPLLEDLPDVEGQRVLVRVDFNVPLGHNPDESAFVADDFRIRAALPTLQWLTDRGARVTACSHLGRPKGKADPRYAMAPVRSRLAELARGVELLENLRFDPGEEADAPTFVDQLVEGYSAYVNDAFGSSHRAHASIVGPPARLPSAAGRLLAREVEVLGGLLVNPSRPFVAVVGGAKVADKLGVLRSLLTRVDHLVVGGGMAFTFLAAQGHRVGASLVDAGHVDDCRALLAESGERILLPHDVVALAPGGTVGEDTPGRGETRIFGTEIPEGWRGLDLGPDSAGVFADVVADAGTVFWNGPMGVFEDDRFAAGTKTMAMSVARGSGFSVVGGGDTVAALDHLSLGNEVGYVSTGGGASLEFLEHGDLPGLDALRHASNAPGGS